MRGLLTQAGPASVLACFPGITRAGTGALSDGHQIPWRVDGPGHPHASATIAHMPGSPLMRCGTELGGSPSGAVERPQPVEASHEEVEEDWQPLLDLRHCLHAVRCGDSMNLLAGEILPQNLEGLRVVVRASGHRSGVNHEEPPPP